MPHAFRRVVTLAAIPAAIALAPAPAAGVSDYEWFDPIIAVRRYLLEGFYEQPDEEAMQQAMLDAMILTLDDPYTVYVPPAAEAEFDKELLGTYVGIGAEVNILDNQLTIVSPLEDSPALEAGVRPGDVVLEIENVSTADRPINECIQLLLGEAGTPVTVRLRHRDGGQEDVTMVRRRIVTPTVKGVRRKGEAWDYWLDSGRRIAYVRITQFIEATTPALLEALQGLQQTGIGGLILDLRGNPGGELGTAIEVADLFLNEGMIVEVTGRSRRGQSWYAGKEGTLPDFPMVVLINGDSASASEIVAGALQANSRAKVLGTRTFGKGSVQELRDLPHDGGMLKLTSGQYTLGSGRTIARTPGNLVWGVDPDDGFVVAMTDEAYFEMLDARRDFEVIGPGEQHNASFEDAAWISRELKDAQLAGALSALQEVLDGREWPVLGQADPTRLALAENIEGQSRFRGHLVEEIARVDERIAELMDLADEAGVPPLLPPEADLAGGTVVLRDRDGNTVGTYRVGDAGDLEIALRLARVVPVDGDGSEGSP